MPHGYKCNVICEPPCLKLHFAISLNNKNSRNLLMDVIVMYWRGWGWGAEKKHLTHQLVKRVKKNIPFLCVLPRPSLTKTLPLHDHALCMRYHFSITNWIAS